jgi:hypothetical protein
LLKFILLYGSLTFSAVKATEMNPLEKMHKQGLLTLEEVNFYHNNIKHFLQTAEEEFDVNTGHLPDEIIDWYWDIVQILKNKIPPQQT